MLIFRSYCWTDYSLANRQYEKKKKRKKNYNVSNITKVYQNLMYQNSVQLKNTEEFFYCL